MVVGGWAGRDCGGGSWQAPRDRGSDRQGKGTLKGPFCPWTLRDPPLRSWLLLTRSPLSIYRDGFCIYTYLLTQLLLLQSCCLHIPNEPGH